MTRVKVRAAHVVTLAHRTSTGPCATLTMHFPSPPVGSPGNELVATLDRSLLLSDRATDGFWASQASTVLVIARALQQADRIGDAPQLLRGKNLALLCASEDADEARLFRRASTALGAQVAVIRPNLSMQSPASEVAETARMLGRLYDAVECQGLAPALVERIALEAGVPVYCGLGCRSHPTAGLADLVGGDVTASEPRCFVLQSALLVSIAR